MERNTMTDSPELPLEGEELDEQHAVRLGKRARMVEAGSDPYPVSVPITTTISQVRADYPELEPEAATGVTVGVAGRVVHMRVTGKLAFLSLQQGNGERLQAMVSFAQVGEESFDALKDLVDLGDHLFVSGEVIASKRGELSVMVDSWAIASKALMPLPNLHSELNEETRVRQRYLDLIVREQARVTVRQRALANRSLRD
ncbi:MAG: lysyl-tRNA synthetase class 2, partial [Pontimonas sp.]